jgi:hypothetical protein
VPQFHKYRTYVFMLGHANDTPKIPNAKFSRQHERVATRVDRGTDLVGLGLRTGTVNQCSSLRYVNIPDSVTLIDNYAFLLDVSHFDGYGYLRVLLLSANMLLVGVILFPLFTYRERWKTSRIMPFLDVLP